MADMTHYKRVQDALAFKTPDRIPRYDNFWAEFTQKCRLDLGLDQNVELADHFGNDLCVAVADETPFSAHTVEQQGADTIIQDGWGCLIRQRKGSYFSEVLQTAIKSPADLARSFRSPSDPERYKLFKQTVMKQKGKGKAVFCKIGGPYIRSSFMRGKEQFLMDICSDPEFATTIAKKVTEHLLQIALESLKKYGDRLALIGGTCNSLVLPNGPINAIHDQTRAIIAAGKEGGVIIGAHSIGPDIPVHHYLAYDQIVRNEEVYSQLEGVASNG